MKKNILISVIIPVYNAERYLTEAIDSVLSQTYRPLELIVVDDGSTDNSASLVQSYPEIRYFYQANQGVAVARNTGLAAARGEFIAFLDADDQWTPNKLTIQMAHLLEHPQLGYTITHQRIVQEPGAKLSPTFKRELLLKDHPGYVPSTLVARKTVFDQIGGFNPAYMNFHEDIEWFSRAKDAGIPMEIITETLLLRRVHNSNLSLQKRMDASSLLKVLKQSINRQSAALGPDNEIR